MELRQHNGPWKIPVECHTDDKLVKAKQKKPSLLWLMNTHQKKTTHYLMSHNPELWDQFGAWLFMLTASKIYQLICKLFAWWFPNIFLFCTIFPLPISLYANVGLAFTTGVSLHQLPCLLIPTFLSIFAVTSAILSSTCPASPAHSIRCAQINLACG